MDKWHAESCAQFYSKCCMPEHTIASYEQLLLEKVFQLIHSYIYTELGEGTRQVSVTVEPFI